MALTLAQQLQAQLGRGVDEDIPLRRADQHGAAVAVIAWVGGATHGTVTADHWNADRGAGAEKRKGSRADHRTPYPGPCGPRRENASALFPGRGVVEAIRLLPRIL